MEETSKNSQQPQDLEPDVIQDFQEELLAEMPALDMGAQFFSGAGNLSEEAVAMDAAEPAEPVMDSFFTTPAGLDSAEDTAPEIVDIPEDVDVPEDVEIPEVVEIPGAEEAAPVTDVPDTAETDEATPVLGPTYEQPYIPAELLQEAAQNSDAPFAPSADLDATQVFTPAAGYDAYGISESQPTAVDQAFLEKGENAQEFAAMFQDANTPAPAANREHRPSRKGRPARKKGDGLFGLPHLLATVIWLMIIVAIGVTLGKAIWVCAADVLAFGRENKPVTVTIVEGDNIDTITAKLHEAGLVQYPGLFKIYAQLTNAEEEITTGSFQLNTNYDYHALVNGLSPSSSSRTVVEILIPEGYNCRQIFELLAANSVCSVESLEAYAASGEFKDFWFLADVERGDKYCLEGFLFPDTYEFYVNSTPREALGKMLTGFETRFTDEMQAQLPALNERLSNMMRANGCSEEFIAEHQIGIRELVTVASLIEEETAGASESPNIASVIYNRLTQDQVYERYLNIDAAIFYALGEHKEALSAEDLKIDSPYNTYTHAGLTPTPITNPGLASLEAALEPADTKYYYYVLNPDTGMHVFSKTYEEHEKLVEKYREAAAAE